MDGRTDGQMDGWIDGRMDGRMDRLMDRWTDERTDFLLETNCYGKGGRMASLGHGWNALNPEVYHENWQ